MASDPDEQARRFLRRDYARVVGVVSLVCPSRAAAEDAVQDALVKAWTRKDDPDSFTAWITVLALNMARSTGRGVMAEQRSFARLAARRQPADNAGEEADQRRDVAVALQALSKRQREVVVLHYWLDLSVQQVADLLSVNPGTVKQHLFRSRNALTGPLVADNTIADRHQA